MLSPEQKAAVSTNAEMKVKYNQQLDEYRKQSNEPKTIPQKLVSMVKSAGPKNKKGATENKNSQTAAAEAAKAEAARLAEERRQQKQDEADEEAALWGDNVWGTLPPTQ